MKLYKIVKPSGEPTHRSRFRWPMPKGNRPGKWTTPVKGPVELCENGYHLATEAGVFDFGRVGFLLCEAEGRGDQTGRQKYTETTKYAFRQARILRVIGPITHPARDAGVGRWQATGATRRDVGRVMIRIIRAAAKEAAQ